MNEAHKPTHLNELDEDIKYCMSRYKMTYERVVTMLAAIGPDTHEFVNYLRESNGDVAKIKKPINPDQPFYK